MAAATTNTADLVADDSFSDEGSDTSSLLSDTTSVTSTIVNYQYENGRRYHAYKQGKYYIPNDEKEQDRLDLAHHVWLLTLKGDLFRAPLPADGPKRILDVGTGTGIWAIEMGDQFPDAEVRGIDLSPIQPGWVPPNVHFEVDDLEDEWTWGQKFDYIHTRNMTGTVKDWADLLRKSYDHLAPNGFVELHESETWPYSDDGTLTDDSAAIPFTKKMHEATALLGRRMDIHSSDLADMMLAAGFVDVTVQNLKMPAGTWPREKRFKEIGLWNRELIYQGTEAFGLALFVRVLGMAESEARELMAAYCEEARRGKVHYYFKSHVVYGRKPTEEERVEVEREKAKEGGEEKKE